MRGQQIKDCYFSRLFGRNFIFYQPLTHMTGAGVGSLGSEFKVPVLGGIFLDVCLRFSDHTGVAESKLARFASNRTSEFACLNTGASHLSIEFRTPRLLILYYLQY